MGNSKCVPQSVIFKITNMGKTNRWVNGKSRIILYEKGKGREKWLINCFMSLNTITSQPNNSQKAERRPQHDSKQIN